MTRIQSLVSAAILGLGMCHSCQMVDGPLESQPWQRFGEGATTVGVSTGWAAYQARARAAGTSGVIQGDTGTDTAQLDPNYGGAIKLHQMVTEHFALGGIVEYRSFDPDPIKPLSATLTADDFETWHFILSSRYFFDGLGETKSWRPFLGVDLSYIPEVELGSVRVDYPNNTGIPDEFIEVTGSDYWALGAVLGLSYQVYDDLAFDIGGFYEYALNTSDASVRFNNLGGATADIAIRSQGLIVFVGLTYAF